jgi:hypothetical protein
MTLERNDLTLEDLLVDPMILALRRADHVDPKSFEIMLRSTALRLETDRRALPPAHLCRTALGRMTKALSGGTVKPATGSTRTW